MKRYVLGFMFCNGHVALIEKKRGPSGLIGKWNGIGGKIEGDEDKHVAMAREFKEETGVATEPYNWVHYGIYGDGQNWSIELFGSRMMSHGSVLPAIECKEAGGENVQWFLRSLVDCQAAMSNLHWLIPMCWQTAGTGVLLNIVEKRD